MEILNKYKKHKHPLVVVNDMYWDFVLSDSTDRSVDVDGRMTEECLMSYVDFTDRRCYDGGDTAYSLPEYSWDGAVSSGATMANIGFTGMDNGLIRFDKDCITDLDFYNRLTRTQYPMPSGDTRLVLNSVAGNTKMHSYDISRCEGDYLSLKGGFMQGFFKLDGYDYQVLPDNFCNDIHFEFVIRPMDYVTRDDTLNSSYPENRGIFFYIGTRSENKFAKMYGTGISMYEDRPLSSETSCYNYFYDDYFKYDDITPDCILDEFTENGSYFTDDYFSSGDTFNYKTDLDSGETFNLTGTTIQDSEEIPFDGNMYDMFETENKYLFFNRTREGFTVDTWHQGDTVKYRFPKQKVNANLYLFMNRTPSGFTVDTVDKVRSGEYTYDFTTDTIVHNVSGITGAKPYDIMSDVTDNAFALKVNEDMSVSYRYLVKDCDSEDGWSVMEESTFPNIIKTGEWSTINVRLRFLNGETDLCCKPLGERKMKIYIYVNGLLKFVSQEVNALRLRRLHDMYTRQEAVPYNISIGGGTQGMSESIWLRYKEVFPKVLPLERNFAGTFIGDIRSFKMYSCPLQLNQIKNNYFFEKNITT